MSHLSFSNFQSEVQLIMMKPCISVSRNFDLQGFIRTQMLSRDSVKNNLFQNFSITENFEIILYNLFFLVLFYILNTFLLMVSLASCVCVCVRVRESVCVYMLNPSMGMNLRPTGH